MLNRLLHRSKDSGLTSSRLFNDRTFYPQFRQDLERAKKEIVIESPFMTKRRIRSLLPSLRRALQRGVKISINTREPSEHDDYFRAEAEWVVSTLQALGVSVLFTGGHHRKLAILDRKVLWEGSHNILSQNTSCEIMRRIDSAKLAKQMIDFIRLNDFL